MSKDERKTGALHRIASVGVGRIGLAHLKALADSCRWEVAYVCDLSPARLALAGKIVPGAQQVQSLDPILDDPTVEALSITTLSDIRPGMIRRTVAAGKHVLCEKPLASTPQEARRLVEELKGTSQLITCNLFNRNAPLLQEAREHLRAGEIGELAVLRVSHCTPHLRSQSRLSDSHFAVEGHTLHDCGMHYVDLLRWFSASDVGDYQAMATRFWNQEYELHFMVQGRMRSGVAFDLHNGFCYTTLSQTGRKWSMLEGIGTRGVITVRNEEGETRLELNGHRQMLKKQGPYGGKKLGIFYEAFADAVESGNLGNLPRIEDAAKASEIANAMVEQALRKPIPNFGRQSDLSTLPLTADDQLH
ncbi:MAG TPA: Gfo/Idh/MocA family oxidoreductase [Chthoniobacteraceae bacterium]|nr:Gfo/Idh/MocA family oxidoreductase [Chthoniobacteraceae bacterium]